MIPPNVSLYSGGTALGSGLSSVDVHNIPIPDSIGTLLQVVINSAGSRTWKIDHVIADGHTFRFDNAQGNIASRYSSHFVVERKHADPAAIDKFDYRQAVLEGSLRTVAVFTYRQISSSLTRLLRSNTLTESFIENQ